MFGESESESPRVPSPWDSLIGTPVSSSPATKPRQISCSPLATATAIVPRLVPENDEGNVEYKLQLLSPSPLRFARLVTQLKWRLLEGGGQAYYELGVADSGALVGLPRAQLEESLETLEMMAGEIGASVIVVKEIEVPAAMAGLAIKEEDHRRVKKKDEYLTPDDESTETETSSSATDDDEVFSMDAESEAPSPPQFTIEVEISSVFKPRPVRTKESNRHLTSPEHHRNKKKTSKPNKHTARKNRQATLKAQPAVIESDPATDSLISGLETLHVSLDEPHAVAIGDGLLAGDDAIPSMSLTAEPSSIEAEDDVFAFSNRAPVATEDLVVVGPLDQTEKRLIVEALVVRKMSLEEAFLDFEGFGFE